MQTSCIKPDARKVLKRSHNIVVKEHLGGNKYKGQINEGPLAGHIVIGNKTKD